MGLAGQRQRLERFPGVHGWFCWHLALARIFLNVNQADATELVDSTFNLHIETRADWRSTTPRSRCAGGACQVPPPTVHAKVHDHEVAIPPEPAQRR